MFVERESLSPSTKCKVDTPTEKKYCFIARFVEEAMWKCLQDKILHGRDRARLCQVRGVRYRGFHEKVPSATCVH